MEHAPKGEGGGKSHACLDKDKKKNFQRTAKNEKTGGEGHAHQSERERDLSEQIRGYEKGWANSLFSSKTTEEKLRRGGKNTL